MRPNEDVLERDKSQTIHKDHIDKLLIEIYKPTHYISPLIMWHFFNFKRNRYNLRGNYLLNLRDTSTCRYWAYKNHASNEVFGGIRFQTNIKSNLI